MKTRMRAVIGAAGRIVQILSVLAWAWPTLAEDYFLAPKHAYCDRCTKVHPIAWSKVGTQNGWFRLFCLCLECLVWDRPPEEASLLRTLYSVDDTVSTCPPLRRSTRVANRTAS